MFIAVCKGLEQFRFFLIIEFSVLVLIKFLGEKKLFGADHPITRNVEGHMGLDFTFATLKKRLKRADTSVIWPRILEILL